MAATIEVRAGRAGFGQVLHAEWTKFRTVRGWVIGMIVAPLVIVGLGQFISSGMVCSEGNRPCAAPLGPDGEAVTDSFYFVGRPLSGNGSITVRVTSLTAPAGGGGTGLQPWSKAGIIMAASTRLGAAYAAMMVTAGHGVRMQYDYTGDTAGLPGTVALTAPRWLRLARSGDTVTGYDSADGRHWARVAAVHLAGLTGAMQAGLFAASPPPGPGVGQGTAQRVTGPTPATATFDHVSNRGTWPPGAWTGTDVGRGSGTALACPCGFHKVGGTFTVSGSGDIAPAVSGQDGGTPLARTLTGAFAGLIAMTVIAAMFSAAEYRRGLLRTTLAASPARGQVLAAKVVVIGAVTFAAGLTGAAVAVPLGERALREHGNFMASASVLTQVRVVAGTAALLAVTAVLGLALGAVLRDTTTAVTAVVAGVVLPYLFAVALPVLPAAAAGWLLRITPAAGFAIQGGAPHYPQVNATYLPFFGYFPLAPWAGFAVLCAWAAAALALAAFLLHRRDA
jgi:ABC-2 family transporter protein